MSLKRRKRTFFFTKDKIEPYVECFRLLNMAIRSIKTSIHTKTFTKYSNENNERRYEKYACTLL